MPSDAIPELDEVDVVLDGLSSPTTREVFNAMRPYNDRIVTAAAAQRAVNGGGGGGGSQPGAARVLGPFPFAFDDAGLEDGIAFYTPTVGDVVTGMAIVTTATWDANPRADIFVGSGAQTGMLQITGVGLSFLESPIVIPGIDYSFAGFGEYGDIFVVETTDPFEIVVSQDGTKGGTPSGATQGEAVIYLVVATPDAP